MIFDLLQLLLVLIVIPKLLWQKIWCNKVFPSLQERLGFHPPRGTGTLRIWVHAVSVGEMKASRALVQHLIAQHRDTQLLVTTATLAGKEEAQRSLPQASYIRILPLDFSWIAKRWIRFFAPHHLIFIEGDLWPNLVRVAKRAGVCLSLVSGKISECSSQRLFYAPFLVRVLFDSLDLLAVQNEQQRIRFARLTHRPIFVLGNLKFDQRPQEVAPDCIRNQFSLASQQPVITIASTHDPEEQELLTMMYRLWEEISDLVVFLAPRHPERCVKVGHLLQKMGLSFSRWKEERGARRIVLVDTMGQLPSCFSVSRLAIVAGSFSSKVGGHNLLEPCLYGCPVLFGPVIFAQEELAQHVLETKAGLQVSSSELDKTIRRELKEPTLTCSAVSTIRPHCSEQIVRLLFPSYTRST
jgi:3-deoxy-D-manno-octulosonic-acid transferase